MKNAIVHNSLSKPVYDRLKNMIETGELSPGQKLIQEKLAEDLGVSRTPLLRALQNLEHEMLVMSIPRKGIYVRKITLQEMIDVYDCRMAVERMAVSLFIKRASEMDLKKFRAVFEPFNNVNRINTAAYRKADENFHDMIIYNSRNPVLIKMSAVSNIHKRVYQFGLLRTPQETLPEHWNIVDAICKRDYTKADLEISNHISLSRKKIVELQEKENEKL